jgi:hypothetical protein
VAHSEQCSVPEEVIEFYSMGRLNGADLQAFEEHLFICPTCRQRVERMDRFLSVLRMALSNQTGLAAAATSETWIAHSTPERQSELREDCSQLVSVWILGGSFPTGSIAGLLVSKSSSGAGIMALTQIPEGSSVLVRMPSFRSAGVVRYCVDNGSTCHIDVEFEPGPGSVF